MGPLDAARLSLEHNLGLKVSKISRDEKEGLLTKAYGKFDWTASLSSQYDYSKTPSTTSLTESNSSSADISRVLAHAASLKKTFQFGTELEIPYSYSRTFSNSTSTLFNPAYEPSFGFKLSQPLLYSLTPSYFTKDLGLAHLNQKIAEQEHDEKINDTILKTMQLYWETIQASESLRIKKASFENAEKNLEFAKAKRSVGRASLTDLLEAQAQTAKQNEAVLRAQDAFESKKAEFVLQTFGKIQDKAKNHEPLELDSRFPEIKVQDKPEKILLKEALHTRPESRKIALSITKAEIERNAANMDRLPKITLEGESTARGLALNSSTAHKDVFNGQFTSWGASITVEQPVFAYAARGAYKTKALRLEQEEIKREQNARDVELELRKYLRELQTEWQRVNALSKAAEAQAMAFEGKSAEYKIGRISTFDLNRTLEAKEQAELDLLGARVALQNANYRLKTAQGTLLRDLGIIEEK
ncbi:MAG: TolC family protein [Bdellovibrionota bacterium]